MSECPASTSRPPPMSLNNQFQFAEMNVRHTGNGERTLALVRRAVRMGYDVVVVNVDIGEMNETIQADDASIDRGEPPTKKPKKKKGGGGMRMKTIPLPYLVDETKLNLTDLEQQGKRFRQFSRITLTLSDSTCVHTMMHHATVKLYDLVAVRASTEHIAQTLVSKGDCVDIITFDPTDAKVPWLLKGKLVQQAIERGLGFELTYSAALKDSSERRQVFSNGRQLMAATRGGRGVVLSSAAEELLDIRAPYDTANLCVLFGCKPARGRDFVSGNAKRILLRSEAKRSIRGAIHVTDSATVLEDTVVPSTMFKRKSALERLLAVPEFRAQLEIVPAKTKTVEKKRGNDDDDE